jgi:hypothetical protein
MCGEAGARGGAVWRRVVVAWKALSWRLHVRMIPVRVVCRIMGVGLVHVDLSVWNRLCVGVQ